MKKLPQPGETRSADPFESDASGDATDVAVDAAPYRAEHLPARDDSLALPDDVAPAPARVDIAAAVAAAGLADGGPGPALGGASAGGDRAPDGAGAKAGSKAGGRRPSAPSLRQRRRFARERAVQALYQWHMTGASSSDVRREFLATQEMDRVDVEYFEAAFRGVTLAPDAVDGALGAVLDRDLAEVDPIERAILRLATWELQARTDVPAPVAISEAVGVAQRFCAEPGYRYVNGVLDRLATVLRAEEMGRA